MTTYCVVSNIWHTKDQKYYEPGELVDLSHLDGIALNVLLNSGAIIPIELAGEKKKKKPVESAQEGE